MSRLRLIAGCPLLLVAVLIAPVRPASPHLVPAASTGNDVTLTAVGDVILGNTPQLPPHPRRYFRGVRGALTKDADIVFANLEGVLTSQSRNKCTGSTSGDCFAFRNPPRFASVLASVGFTVLNSANNHSHDFYQVGADDTTAAIDAAGLAQTGVLGRLTYLRAAGRRVAILGFAPYKATPDLRDLATAADLISKAHHRADIVIVYMHAGAEGAAADHVSGREEYAFGEDRGNPERFAHMAVRHGADLVIASGPHVLRGMEFFRGRLIAYSLGDSANYHNFAMSPPLDKSVVLRVTLGPRGRFRTATLTSVRLVAAGRPVAGGDSLGFVRRLSKEDFGTRAARIGRNGIIRPPG